MFCWDADEWYEINTRTLHQINCPNHRMYTIKDGKPHIQSMKEFYEEHQNSSHGHRGKFVTTFKFDGDYKLDFSDDYLRLVVAYQADGTLYNNGGASRTKLAESHRRWENELSKKNEEKLSRTQELNTAKVLALKELGYTEINEHNASEVFDKIAEIQSRGIYN